MSDFSTGWIAAPNEVELIVKEQAIPFFFQTPAAEVDTIPPEVFLWRYKEKITGKPWPNRDQGGVGSCVSFGTVAAIEATMCFEIANGESEEVRDLCQEVVYAGSRVEIGGNRIQGDGSIGAWAAQFVKDYGVLDRAVYGSYDLARYDEVRCRAWGRKGVPDDLEPAVKKHPIKAITMVRSWDDAKKSLASGYGIAICSNQGFGRIRDSAGFAKASGRWAHCMALLGYQTGSREGGWICNSWGDRFHSGPVGAGAPTCGFWADADIIERMLKAEDSWAFSSLEGFPARKIDWII